MQHVRAAYLRTPYRPSTWQQEERGRHGQQLFKPRPCPHGSTRPSRAARSESWWPGMNTPAALSKCQRGASRLRQGGRPASGTPAQPQVWQSADRKGRDEQKNQGEMLRGDQACSGDERAGCQRRVWECQWRKGLWWAPCCVSGRGICQQRRSPAAGSEAGHSVAVCSLGEVRRGLSCAVRRLPPTSFDQAAAATGHPRSGVGGQGDRRRCRSSRGEGRRACGWPVTGR